MQKTELEKLDGCFEYPKLDFMKNDGKAGRICGMSIFGTVLVGVKSFAE